MDKELYICSYAYMDGGMFVRVSAAMDAIIRRVAEERKRRKEEEKKDNYDDSVRLVYIDTPTHPHVVPVECKAISNMHYQSASLFQKIFQALGVLKPNGYVSVPAAAAAAKKSPSSSSSGELLCDGLLPFQGPNYAVGKLLQRIRAMNAYLNGWKVSITVGPGTATNSVLHAKLAAKAVKYMHNFRPNEFFLVETVKPLLFIFLVNDLLNPKSRSTPPSGGVVKAADFFKAIVENSWHGGVWCSAYLMRSTSKITMFYYVLDKYGALGVALLMGFGVAVLRSLGTN